MPKINYNLNNEAIPKHCGYCGKKFYPKFDEDFCDYLCEHHFNDYIKDIETMWIEDLYKQDEEYM